MKFNGRLKELGKLVAVIAVSVMMVMISGCIGSNGGSGGTGTAHGTSTIQLNQTKLSFIVYSTSPSTCGSLRGIIEGTFNTKNVSCKSVSPAAMNALGGYTGTNASSLVAVRYGGNLRVILVGNFKKELEKQRLYSLIETGIREKGIAVAGGSSGSESGSGSGSGSVKVLKGNTAFYVRSILTYDVIPSKLHFYMYGEHTCPHCRDMMKWIPQVYGNGSLTFYDLVGSKYNRELFLELYKLIGVTGVPVIGITYNGTLRAVINSEYNVSATPSIVRSAAKNNGVLIYIGKWYILYYNRNSSRVLINALYKIFVDHESVNTTKVLKEAKELSGS
ncbi:MAG: hypothetical protein GXO14_02235 [Thermococci archaeon]|nr:hypothetical protein [Thermococci archaeon]